MSNQNKIKRKLTQLNAIHHNTTILQYKTFKEITKDVKVDTRLVSFLHKNNILQKKNNVIVWNNSIKPNAALASTYQSYIDVMNAKQRGKRTAVKTVSPTPKPKSERHFSFFWGLINFKY